MGGMNGMGAMYDAADNKQFGQIGDLVHGLDAQNLSTADYKSQFAQQMDVFEKAIEHDMFGAFAKFGHLGDHDMFDSFKSFDPKHDKVVKDDGGEAKFMTS